MNINQFVNQILAQTLHINSDFLPQVKGLRYLKVGKFIQKPLSLVLIINYYVSYEHSEDF